MPRGGKREGAGRKSGTPNKASLTRQKAAEATGAMPANVMLDAMRLHYEIANIERAKAKPDLAIVKAELALAHGFARDAAPYYHPKLATLQSNVNLTGRLTLEQLVETSILDAAKKKAEENKPE